MAEVLKTIGSDSRQYATVTSWEAAAYGATAADDAIGEMYADSTFAETADIDNTTPITVILRAASTERHDGTAGTGVVISKSNTGIFILGIDNECEYTSIEWIELTTSLAKSTGNYVATGVRVDNNTVDAVTDVKNCIIHRLFNYYNNGSTTPSSLDIYNGGQKIRFLRNICYDFVTNTNTNDATAPRGVKCRASATATESYFYNNTIYNVARLKTTGGGAAYGMQFYYDYAALKAKNNLVGGVTNAEDGGTALCIEAHSNVDEDYNCIDDASSDGANSVESITFSDQVVSTTGGSEDLHLKSGADAIDEGVDFGTTPTGVNIDIDGRDVDSEGDTWDIGAHEYVAAGGGEKEASPSNMSSLSTLADPVLSYHPASLQISNLASLSTVEDIVLGMVLKAGSLSSLSVVDAAKLCNVLVASGLSSLSTVGAIVVGKVLKATGISSLCTVADALLSYHPASLQVGNLASLSAVEDTTLSRALKAAGISSLSTVADLLLSYHPASLQVSNLASLSTVEKPSMAMVIKPSDLSSLSTIPAGVWVEILGGALQLNASDLSSLTTVADPLLSFHPASLQVTSLSSLSTVEDVVLGMCLVPTDLSSLSTIDTPNITMCLTPSQVSSLSTVGSVTLGRCLVAANLSSLTTVDDVRVQITGAATALSPSNMSALTIIDDVVLTRMRESGVKITGINIMTGEPIIIIGTQIVSYPLP